MSEHKKFKIFLNQNKNKPHLKECIKRIKRKYNEAVKIAENLYNKQEEISTLKNLLQINGPSTDIKLKLHSDQEFYCEQLYKLHYIRADIEELIQQLNKLKIKIMDDYKLWIVRDNHVAGDCNMNPHFGHFDESKPITGYIQLLPEKEEVKKSSSLNVVTFDNQENKQPNMNYEDKKGRKIYTKSSRSVKVGKRHTQLSLVQCKSADYINQRRVDSLDAMENEFSNDVPPYYKFVRASDTPEFISYLKSIPLTGDDEVDDEIIKFYRIKYHRPTQSLC